MSIDSLSNFITVVGFPCAMVVFLLWYMGKYINKKDEQNREDTTKQIQELKTDNKETIQRILKESKIRECESRSREDKLHSVIFKNQEIISDLATKFDVIKDVKQKVEDIEEQVSKISEKINE